MSNANCLIQEALSPTNKVNMTQRYRLMATGAGINDSIYHNGIYVHMNKAAHLMRAVKKRRHICHIPDGWV